MASPRTMHTTSIQLGLLNIACTVGKASSEERESAITTIAVDEHGQPAIIDRSERVAETGSTVYQKAKAVKMEDDSWRVISESEWDEIEKATKLPTLKVLDVQKLSKLPMMYSTGCYYLRFDTKAKQAPDAFAVLMAALTKTQTGLIVKWGANASRQKLAVISAEAGVLIMRVIPFLTEIRVASKQERAHFKAEFTEREVEKMTELLREIQNPKGFQYAEYADEGLKLRSAAVDKIIAGEKPDEISEPEQQEQQTSIFDAIEAAVAGLKQ
jgi:non-homologous end joining protein Ku